MAKLLIGIAFVGLLAFLPLTLAIDREPVEIGYEETWLKVYRLPTPYTLSNEPLSQFDNALYDGILYYTGFNLTFTPIGKESSSSCWEYATSGASDPDLNRQICLIVPNMPYAESSINVVPLPTPYTLSNEPISQFDNALHDGILYYTGFNLTFTPVGEKTRYICAAFASSGPIDPTMQQQICFAIDGLQPLICGNNYVDIPNIYGVNEKCDGIDDAVCPGECIPPGQKGECRCGNICGNDVKEGTEECDGNDSVSCNGVLCIPAGQQYECSCSKPFVPVEICDNGVDDEDLDDDVDCYDTDCCADPVCTTSQPGHEGDYGLTCCYNGVDDDNNGMMDADGTSPDPNCVTLGGSFNSYNQTDETATFYVNFTDTSVGPTQVSWAFDDSKPTGCVYSTITYSPSEQTRTFAAGGIEIVGTINVTVSPASYCQVAMIATDVLGNSVGGLYTLTGPNYASAGSSAGMDIPELPAIIYPTNIYSTKINDAKSAFASATSAVNYLQSKCSQSCGSAAQAKLFEAQTNLRAAEFYSDSCTSNGDIACQLSQYYSDIAKKLANEGTNLI